MFKKFLEKKGITDEQWAAKSAQEVAVLEAEYKAEQDAARSAEFKKMIDDAKAGLTTPDALKAALKEFGENLDISDSQAMKDLKATVDANVKTIAEYEAKAVEMGKVVQNLKAQGGINNDGTFNKSVLRTIVEKHLEDAGLLGEELENEHGIKCIEVKIPSNQKIADSGSKQIADIRELSKKHVAQKAGEGVYIGGTGTQAVFNQAVARHGIGVIAPPLTADEHAIDIFRVTPIAGSLMTLLVYENLEANGELVAEGVAPSADSRIELTSKDFKVFDFSATATISKNLLRDKGEVVNELVRQLEDNLKTVISTKIFTAGGDNTADPFGAFNTSESCELFNPLLFAGQSPNANLVSVAGKAKLQARLNNWMSDSMILNPMQWDEVEDLKDSNKNSIRDNRLAVNSLGEVVAVKGMFKHQTTKMPENTLLVFNSGLETIGLRQDIETQFGHNDDDFKKRRVSFLMDMRGAYGQQAKKSAIYVDNISDAIAILSENAAASLARIVAMAPASDASALTIAQLTNAGVTGVSEASLGDYKIAVAGESTIADLAALQTVIDAA